MSVLLIGSSIVISTRIPATALQEGGDGRTAARSPFSRTAISGDVFGTIYDLATIAHALVRRRVGDGRPAEPGAAVSAALRHGAGLGARDAAARRAHHGHLLLRHDLVRRRRRRAGRRVRHRRADADDVVGGRRRHRAAGQPRTTSCRSRSSSSTRSSSTSGSSRTASRSPAWFIVTIIVASLVSRVMRSTEIRIEGVDYDDVALGFIREAAGRRSLRIIASRPNTGDEGGVPAQVQRRAALASPAAGRRRCCSSRCGRATPRSSRTRCTSRASRSAATASCAATSPAIPNAIAGLLLDLRDRTYSIPHAYFGWTEGNPITYLLRFLAFGEGDTAPVCREVLRQAEPDPARRPRIHVG